MEDVEIIVRALREIYVNEWDEYCFWDSYIDMEIQSETFDGAMVGYEMYIKGLDQIGVLALI